MTTEPQGGILVSVGGKIDLIEGLQRALDRNYRRLLQVAKADWEHLFCGKEASDGCVSVRIHPGPKPTGKRPQPGSAFLAKSKGEPTTKVRRGNPLSDALPS